MDDMVGTLTALFDVGGVVVVTFMLWVVWRRLTELTDRFIDILEELRLQSIVSRAERDEKNQHDLK